MKTVDAVLEDLQGMTRTAARPIYEIAKEIRKDWRNVNFAATPYLDAMADLAKITDSYGFDSAKEIVARFLSNASQWKGDKAKEIKKELKQMAGMKAGSEKTEEDVVVAALEQMLNKEPPASETASALPGDEIQGRFEEGKPADPCENMTEADCAEWKKQNEEHKDEFKTASSEDQVLASLTRMAEVFPPKDLPKKLTQALAKDLAKWVQRKKPDSLFVMLQDEKWDQKLKSALSGYVEATFGQGMSHIADWLKKFSRDDLKKFARTYLESTGKSFSFEKMAAEDETIMALELMAEGCPDNLDESECQEWEANTEKYRDKFKTAAGRTTHLENPKKKGFTLCGERLNPGTEVSSVKDTTCFYCNQAWQKGHGGIIASQGPDARGHNWQERNDHLGHRWMWADRDTNIGFGVYEFQGPGIPLYRLQIVLEDGTILKYRRQLKNPQDMFKIAAGYYKGLSSEAGGGVIFDAQHWMRLASKTDKCKTA